MEIHCKHALYHPQNNNEKAGSSPKPRSLRVSRVRHASARDPRRDGIPTLGISQLRSGGVFREKLIPRATQFAILRAPPREVRSSRDGIGRPADCWYDPCKGSSNLQKISCSLNLFRRGRTLHNVIDILL